MTGNPIVMSDPGGARLLRTIQDLVEWNRHREDTRLSNSNYDANPDPNPNQNLTLSCAGFPSGQKTP